MRTASALPDHDAPHMQLLQPDTHAPIELLENVIDRRGSAVLKGFQKYVVKCHIDPMIFAKHSINTIKNRAPPLAG